MSRWPRGEAQVEQLTATKKLQQVIGGQATGEHLHQKASRTLETAGQIVYAALKWVYTDGNQRVEFSNRQLLQRFSCVERVTGIEPALSAWELLERRRINLAR